MFWILALLLCRWPDDWLGYVRGLENCWPDVGWNCLILIEQSKAIWPILLQTEHCMGNVKGWCLRTDCIWIRLPARFWILIWCIRNSILIRETAVSMSSLAGTILPTLGSKRVNKLYSAIESNKSTYAYFFLNVKFHLFISSGIFVWCVWILRESPNDYALNFHVVPLLRVSRIH